MKVLIFPDKAKAITRTAAALRAAVTRKPDTVLGLATGGTMEPVYAALADKPGGCSFSRVTTFNLDEYVGLAPEHPQSYRSYMRRHLFDHLDFDPAKTHLPHGAASNPEAEAGAYETLITRAGGIDLQLLGLGANGHIGFNEPGSSLGSPTRIKTLTQKTRNDNARFFGPDETVPRYAITMGIRTITFAREILLLAVGSAKAAAAEAMIEGPVSAFCPASALQFHPRATIVLDEESAACLKLRDYYEVVHPQGEEIHLGQ
ncbi:MAG: glucosamine-6-phosphate deaminase [Pseudorhodobacter sp.]